MKKDPPSRRNYRPDHDGPHRLQFDRNKKIIYATQTVCGICGKPVDMSLKYPHPMSKCIDHIIPVSKGGHPSDIDNLQLAHWACNRQKSDKLTEKKVFSAESQVISNRLLPHHVDWFDYHMKSHYSQTIYCFAYCFCMFDYHMKSHYSQTSIRE